MSNTTFRTSDIAPSALSARAVGTSPSDGAPETTEERASVSTTHCSQSADPAGLSGELPLEQPELFATARQAVAALRGRGRLRNGRAGSGNTMALRHGCGRVDCSTIPTSPRGTASNVRRLRSIWVASPS